MQKNVQGDDTMARLHRPQLFMQAHTILPFGQRQRKLNGQCDFYRRAGPEQAEPGIYDLQWIPGAA